MQKLINQIVNEIKLQIFNEEENSDLNVVAVYPGRFQPMGRHHKVAYDWLVKKFGKSNTYVVTSDKVDPQRSPLNFEEKKAIIGKHGVENVIQVTMPYNITEFMTKMNFDPKTTVLVYMVGEKDKDRMKSLKRMMVYNETTRIPVKDIENPYAYYILAPHVKLNIPEYGEMSGTTIRQALSDRSAKLSLLKSRFKSIMGWFDANTFNMVISKFNTNRGDIKEELGDWKRELLNMSKKQTDMFFDALKKEYGDTKDLLPIIQKYIKTRTLTDDEKRIFQKQMKDNAKLLGLGAMAAIPIPGTVLLIPTIIQVAKKFNVNLLPEDDNPEGETLSIVRREFWNEVFSEVVNEDVLLMSEGGAAGHMQHLFEDFDLTFGDVKELFRLWLSGEITTNGSVTEKLDGMNLYVTYRDSNLYAARNIGDIRAGGMDYERLKAKYKGNESVQKAFLFAFTDLERVLRQLPQSTIHEIFSRGNVWINLEVIYPETPNIINYDGAHIVFHDIARYSEDGKRMETYGDYTWKLVDAIYRIDAHRQETFTIEKPKTLKIGRSKKFNNRLQYFASKLTYLQNQMSCNDSDTIGVWHRRWWEQYITKNSKEAGITVDDSTMNHLVNRWAFRDKSYRLNPETIPDNRLRLWSKTIDKLEVDQHTAKNVRPFELLMLEFGAEVLKNIDNSMVLNPTNSTDSIKATLRNAIQQIQKSNDVRDIEVLDKELDRFEKIGGADAIVPIEGVVFTYNGKTYKLTGAFAPISQIMSYLSRRR